MRGREFVMKDLYSFHTTQEDLDKFYEKVTDAYKEIYKKCGIGDKTLVTFASGGAFAKYSHEFQTLSDVGEDTIYVSTEKNIAINKEVYTDEALADLGLKKENLEERKAIEVGNIFKLGTRFSEALDLAYTDEDGLRKPVIMGCYGFGPSRVMGTIVEVLSDEKGIIWPESVAPFKVHLVELGNNDEKVNTFTKELYADLQKNGVSVLYDDRVGASAGEKFADSDLLGMPYRVIVSKKTLEEGKLEIKERKTGEVRMINKKDLFSL